jgi:multidrug resistance efflux pump
MDESLQTLVPEANSSDLVQLLTRFEGTAEQFLLQMLVYQCRLTRADAGAVLRTAPMPVQTPEGEAGGESEDGQSPPAVQVQVLASFPPIRPGTPPPQWLSAAAEGFQQLLGADTEAMSSAVIEPEVFEGESLPSYIVLVPLKPEQLQQGVAAFWLHGSDEQQRAHVTKMLELCGAMTCAYEMRVALQQRSAAMAQVQQGLQVLAGVNEQKKLQAAAMAICNQLAARFGAERVSLGFLSGRYVKLKALSHTEKISRKMRLVQDIESVMEECLDQDVEVIHPSPANASYVSRAVSDHAKRNGPLCVCTLPLRRDRRVEGAIALERAPERPFTTDEVQRLRLTLELCTARLIDLYEHDRWFGARWARSWRDVLSYLVGPKHTWAKVAAIGIFAFLCFATFVKGTHRIEASFVVEAIEQAVVPTPFDGHLKTVHVEPGDPVVANQTVLATLDTATLRLERSATEAELAGYLKEADFAREQRKLSEAEVARFKAEQARARIEVLSHRIRQATILAPIDGVILSGDLKKKVGAPLQSGDLLFEIAPLAALRAKLSVPDDKIVYVNEGDTGELAAAAHPGRYIRFSIEKVNPIAEVVNQKNVFLVRATFDDVPERVSLRPGMEGVAKVHAGKRPYIDLWTRDLVNWVRMKLWL